MSLCRVLSSHTECVAWIFRCKLHEEYGAPPHRHRLCFPCGANNSFFAFHYAFPSSSLWKTERTTRHHALQGVPGRPWNSHSHRRSWSCPPSPQRSVRTCGCPHMTEGSVHLGCSGRLRGTRVPGTRGREGAAADSLGTDHGRSATHSRRGCGPFSPSPTCWEWKGQMAERERERPSSPDHLGAGYAGNYSSFTRNRQWGSLTLKRSLFGHLSSW